MVPRLRERFEAEVLANEDNLYSFFRSLDSENPADVIELCRDIINTINYDTNPHVVKAAFSKLAHLRDTESNPALEKLRGTWKDTYLSEYEYLVALMENAREGAICNCDVYQDGRFNVPPYQNELEETGHSSKKYDDYMTTELLYVKCRICKREWEVEIDSSYHYPHSHWRLSKR
jgi:hypothetical protein